VTVELLISRNPDPDSTLPYLLRVPIGDVLVFRVRLARTGVVRETGSPSPPWKSS